jgi:DNA replication protein DnaC
MIAADTDLDALFKRLHLANARRVWRGLLDRAERERWSYRDFLTLLATEEIAHRQQTRLARLTRRAHFPYLKTIDDFNFTYQSALRLQMLGSALAPDFVTDGRSLILAGKPGRGKTHLAIAVAYRAIQNGFDAFFTTAAALIDDLSAAFRAGELSTALPTYTHPAVLVVDEVGYLTYGTDAANMLFHVVNERHRRQRPMIFTTNKSLKAWGRVLHDDDLAQAIIDRVLERGRLLRLDGPSVRTLHVNLDEAMKEDSDQQADLVRISGKSRSEFPEPTPAAPPAGREQRLRNPALKDRAVRIHGYGHRGSAGNPREAGTEEEFPIRAPHGPVRRASRDLPPSLSHSRLARIQNGERADEETPTTHFHRHVDDPTPVGGKLCRPLIEAIPEQQDWFPLALEGQCPHVIAGFRRVLGVIEQETAIVRPARHEMARPGLFQQLDLVRGPGGGPYIQGVPEVPAGVRDACAVGRPHAGRVVVSAEGETRASTVGHVDGPEIAWDVIVRVTNHSELPIRGQTWRQRPGLPGDAEWDRVLAHLSPLPSRDGFCVNAESSPETFTLAAERRDHPTLLAPCGILPCTGGDREMMRRTLAEVMRTWNFSETWGWDYPLIAMTAGRVGEPGIAIDALLMDTQKNTYLPNGHNYQMRGSPCICPATAGS